MIDGIELAEYFKYHPPLTQERKDAHERVNRLCLTACEDFFGANSVGDVQQIYSAFHEEIVGVTKNKLCQKWILNTLEQLLISASLKRSDESIMMNIQQIRMFANQGITIDELESGN